MPSRNATNNGNTTGKGVCRYKRNTLKVTTFKLMKSKIIFFFNQSYYFIGRSNKCWLFEQGHYIVLFVEIWYE